MTSRRRFLTAGAAGTLLARSAGAAKTELNSEVEARIARHDLHGLTKEDLPTPALVLDEALFEKNLHTMAAHNKATGLKLRAHVKIHKCPEISKRQIALGANGVCCATTAECELLINSGVHGVLHTCQPAGRNQIARTVALARRDPTFTGVLDDPITVDALEEALAAAHVKMNVIVDVYAGLDRQGCPPGETALRLAQKVDQSKHMKLAGIMGYSGGASHTHGWEAAQEEVHGRCGRHARNRGALPQIRTARRDRHRRQHRHLQHRYREPPHRVASRLLHFHGHAVPPDRRQERRARLQRFRTSSIVS